MSYQRLLLVSFWAGVLLLLFLQYQLWFGSTGLLSLWHLEEKIVADSEQLNRLNERSDQFKYQINLYNDNPSKISEGVARKTLNMIAPGDQLIRIIPDSSETP